MNGHILRFLRFLAANLRRCNSCGYSQAVRLFPFSPLPPFSLSPFRVGVRLRPLLPAALLICLTACRTVGVLPPVDLSEAGWTIRQGQALWRSRAGAPEIAGEILLATHPDGREFVQFTKSPFPLVAVQTTTNGWQLEAPVHNQRFSARGRPPARILWFQLPRAAAGSTLPGNWSWQNAPDGWRLENQATGESLQGYFTP